MLKKTISYKDYNGETRTEDFYFNLSKAEIIELQMSEAGGYEQFLKKIIASKDSVEAMKTFKKIIMSSYGEKSPDGKRFIKSKELSEEFVQTEAYSELIMELIQTENAAVDFCNGILPSDISESVDKSDHPALKN